MSLLREGHRIGDGVVQRRAAGRKHARERPADRVAIGGPVLHQHRIVAEPVQKELVLGTGEVVEKLIERGLRRLHLFARHALARVERDAEAHRHAVRAEMRHRLRLVVFVDEEVFLAQPGHEPAARIDDRRGDVDQLDAALEAEPGIGILARRRRRLLLPLR